VRDSGTCCAACGGHTTPLAEGCSTAGGRSHHGRRLVELHRCPGCLVPAGRYSRGLTRVSLASLVMASSFPCCEIRQLLVHVYPGGSKAPGAECITIIYGLHGAVARSKSPASSRLSWPISGRGSCRPVASALSRCSEGPAGQHRRHRARPWPAALTTTGRGGASTEQKCLDMNRCALHRLKAEWSHSMQPHFFYLKTLHSVGERSRPQPVGRLCLPGALAAALIIPAGLVRPPDSVSQTTMATTPITAGSGSGVEGPRTGDLGENFGPTSIDRPG
jgi:hypothetical protein